MASQADRGKLRKILDSGEPSLAALELVLGTPTESDLRELLQLIRISGTLICKIPNAKKEVSRLKFTADVLKYYTQHLPDAAPELRRYIFHKISVEKAYRAILDTLAEQEASGLSPAEQVWLSMDISGKSIEDIYRQVDEKIEALDPDEAHILSGTIADASGQEQNVDSLISMIAAGLYATLLTFAYSGDWYKKGVLEIPAKPHRLPDPNLSAPNTYLASLWQHLEDADEQVRFFGGQVSCRTRHSPDVNGVERHSEVIYFESNITNRIYETIARERFDSLLMAWFIGYKFSTEDDKFGEDEAAGVSMLPAAFLNAEERLCCTALEKVLYLDVTSQALSIRGLQIAPIIRGYHLLQRLALEGEGFGFMRFSFERMTERLVSAGQTPQQAKLFIDLATMGKGKRDLYDAPLLKDNEGILWLFSGVMRSANVLHIITSQLSSENIQTAQKGPPAERGLRKLFEDAGIPVSEVNFSVDSVHYQCDAVVLWKRHLFVIELKNHLLPLGTSVEYSYQFWRTLEEDAIQCSRIAKSLSAQPETIRSVFPDAEFDEVHSVLLNALPFSLDYRLHGVYVYDLSALGRFFKNPDIYIDQPGYSESVMNVLRHRIGCSWKGEDPTPEDLLSELQSPLQLKILRDRFRIENIAVELSDQKIMVVPLLRRDSSEIRDLPAALGWNEDEIADFVMAQAKMSASFESFFQQDK